MPVAPIDLLSMLAEGLDFRSGEQVAPDHLLNEPSVIRALHWALRKVSTPEKIDAKSDSSRPANQGAAWSDEEDDLLTSGFHKCQTWAAMALAHERSSGAIRARLRKLGLIV